MPDIWDTQAVLQTLTQETGAFRASQTGLIFLCSEANAPDIQATQIALQALLSDTAVQTSQAVLESMVPDAGFSHLAYIMRATDAAGDQYVYWETDNPSETAVITYPMPVGVLTDVRIFYEF